MRITRICVFQEIEAPDLIRTIIGAPAGADAAVINLDVEPVFVVDRGFDRTNRLAGRMLTLHAWHWLEEGFGIIHRAFVVMIHAQPMHLAAHLHLFFTHYGDIVLRLARDGAGVAPDAGVQVDRHGPLIVIVFVRWI